MTHGDARVSLPSKAFRQFENAAGSDWGEAGVPLAELLRRVNGVAALLPDAVGRDTRVSRKFSPRSFRHYQTLGCIDPPEKEGNRALYGFRHFVQALLVRKLLWERVHSGQIAVLMAGRSTDETRQLLLGSVEMVVRAGGGEGEAVSGSSAPEAAETWKRIPVASGVELHMRDDLPIPKRRELAQIAKRLEKALRRGR